jgi:hypothetical protein
MLVAMQDDCRAISLRMVTLAHPELQNHQTAEGRAWMLEPWRYKPQPLKPQKKSPPKAPQERQPPPGASRA